MLTCVFQKEVMVGDEREDSVAVKAKSLGGYYFESVSLWYFPLVVHNRGFYNRIHQIMKLIKSVRCKVMMNQMRYMSNNRLGTLPRIYKTIKFEVGNKRVG